MAKATKTVTKKPVRKVEEIKKYNAGFKKSVEDKKRKLIKVDYYREIYEDVFCGTIEEVVAKIKDIPKQVKEDLKRIKEEGGEIKYDIIKIDSERDWDEGRTFHVVLYRYETEEEMRIRKRMQTAAARHKKAVEEKKKKEKEEEEKKLYEELKKKYG